MLRTFVAFLISRPLLAHLALLALVVGTVLVTVPGLRVERYPGRHLGIVVISVAAPGMSPAELETQVLRPVEDSLRGLDGLREITSESSAGMAWIRLEGEPGASGAALTDRVRLRLAELQPRMPLSDGRPAPLVILPIEIDQVLPVVQMNVLAPAGTDGETAEAAAKRLADRLGRLPGVRLVSLEGRLPRQVRVELDPDRLATTGISVQTVTAAITAAGGQARTAQLARPGEAPLSVVADPRFRSQADLLAVVVEARPGTAPVTVADLVDPAGTGLRPEEGSTPLMVNGRTAVGCRVVKRSDADARQVRVAVQAATDAWLAEPAQAGLAVIPTLDAEPRIAATFDLLVGQLAQGAVLVVVLLALAVSWRAALLTTVGLATTLAATLLGMYLSGGSLNEISMVALVIVAGVLVADEVVVIDAIERLRAQGRSGATAAAEAVAELAAPVTASTLTAMAGFLPLLAMGGIVGVFLRDLPLIASAALLISLAECLLLLPVHAGRLLRGRIPPEEANPLAQRGLAGFLARTYEPFLAFALARPWRVIAGLGLLTVLAAGVVVQARYAPDWGQRPLLRLGSFPDDPRQATVALRLPPGTTLPTTTAEIRRLTANLAKEPGITAATGTVGGLVDRADRWRTADRFAQVEVEFATSDTDGRGRIDHLRRTIEGQVGPGWEVEVAGISEGPGGGLDLKAVLSSDDSARLGAAAADLQAWLTTHAAELPGLVDVASDLPPAGSQVAITIDPVRAGAAGVAPSNAMELAAGAVSGLFAGDCLLHGEVIPVRVAMSAAALADARGILDAPLLAGANGPIRLRDLGGLVARHESTGRLRQAGSPAVTVGGRLTADSPIGPAHCDDAVNRWWHDHGANHPGVALRLAGDAAEGGARVGDLLGALIIAVLAVMGLLSVEFGRARLVFAVMTSVLAGAVGMIVALGGIGLAAAILPDGAIHPGRTTLTLLTTVALVAQTGIVVGDAIIMVDLAVRRQTEGFATALAVRIASHQRLRAVLLTSAAALLGTFTMALGIPQFSPTWTPLATCFVAGQIASTLLTLIVLPAVIRLLLPDLPQTTTIHRPR